MHASEPAIPTLAASRILASMSQSTYPANQVVILSVGHIRALTKLHRLTRMVHEIKLQGARLRFVACHTRGGMPKTIAMIAKVGKAMDAGVKLSALGSNVAKAMDAGIKLSALGSMVKNA